MKVYIEKQDKHLVLDKKKLVKAVDVLKELKINPSTVILVKNDEIILEDELLEKNDDIKILSVISGG
jgi:sulfur carrier protein